MKQTTKEETQARVQWYADELKEYKDAVFVLEATSFEKLACWREYNREFLWKDTCSGYGFKVGGTNEWPTFISITSFTLNGFLIVVYHDTSAVVDHNAIDAFFAEAFPTVRKIDAGNFHQIAHHVRDLEVKKSVDIHPVSA